MHLITYIEYLCFSNDILYVRNVCLVLRGRIQLFYDVHNVVLTTEEMS